MIPEESTRTRRRVLKTTGALIAAGTLAGCSSETSDDSESGGDGGDGGDGDSGGNSDPRSFDGWFETTDNYDGVEDETGSNEVSVTVGAEGNGGNLAFGPAAIKVDTGTTVVWEWNGEGGQHNVVDEGGDFESDLTQEEGFTFEYTFESAGTFKYACSPHEALGMKGVVVAD
jgi:halocyanin-like protein